MFKRKQRGKIGLALNGDWYEAKPAADLGEQRRNEKAAERALEFSIGWFARPLYQVRRLRDACCSCRGVVVGLGGVRWWWGGSLGSPSAGLHARSTRCGG